MIVLIDDGILENTDNFHPYYKGPVYDHMPATSNISYFKFYSNYLKYYFSDYFVFKHIYFKITGDYKEKWMSNAFENPNQHQTFISQNYPSLADSLIETDFNEYKRVFNPDYSIYQKQAVSLDQRDIAHLQEINQIFKTNNINYKIIYPPNFHKHKINPNIKTVLTNLFAQHFYDFSGVNRISSDSTLYYENLHFTYKAANLIIDSILKDSNGR